MCGEIERGRKARKGGRKEGRNEGNMDRRNGRKQWRKQGWRPQKKEQTIDLKFSCGKQCSIVFCRESQWVSNGSLLFDSTDQREAVSLQQAWVVREKILKS